jgi:Fe-S-cluster containining protein
MLGLEQIYSIFSQAETELEKQLGTPICVPNCGKCCEVTVPITRRVEAIYMLSTVTGEGTLERLADYAESWLRERHKETPTYEGPCFGRVPPHIQREFEAIVRTPCPFLSAEKRCLVHTGRPLVCRAYGVTHMPGPEMDFCPRKLGTGETASVRGYVGIPEIRQLVDQYYRNLADKELKVSGLLPGLILKKLRPETWKGLLADNKIASAKLIGFQHYPGLIWQADMERAYKEARRSHNG